MKISFRSALTAITLILLVVVIIFAWPEIVKGWELMGQVNLAILALLIPVQFFSYYATGGMIFSYLRSKGDIKDMTHWSMTRLSLELNFVNHILPSGGAAGFSYLSWVLSRHHVSVARSTMSQIIRFVLTFLSFVLLLLVAIIILAFNHQIDRVIVLVSLVLVMMAFGVSWFAVWLIQNRRRLERFSVWFTNASNKVVAWFTRGHKTDTVKYDDIYDFFKGLHDDYLEIKRERRLLFWPFVWAAIANLLDVALIWISFWSLGYAIDPALTFVAFGIASIAGSLSVTPGGAGVYDVVMVAFLAASGVTPDVAVAGTLLARVTLLAGTIIFGYFFYQLTIMRYGKHTD